VSVPHGLELARPGARTVRERAGTRRDPPPRGTREGSTALRPPHPQRRARAACTLRGGRMSPTLVLTRSEHMEEHG